MLNVKFIDSEGAELKTVQAEPGSDLRKIAQGEDLNLYRHVFKLLNCRGKGLCGSCLVEIESGDAGPLSEIESKKLKSKLSDRPNIRLACQVTVDNDLVVKTQD